MGEAKERGSFEERKRQAEERDQQATENDQLIKLMLQDMDNNRCLVKMIMQKTRLLVHLIMGDPAVSEVMVFPKALWYNLRMNGEAKTLNLIGTYDLSEMPNGIGTKSLKHATRLWTHKRDLKKQIPLPKNMTITNAAYHYGFTPGLTSISVSKDGLLGIDLVEYSKTSNVPVFMYRIKVPLNKESEAYKNGARGEFNIYPICKPSLEATVSAVAYMDTETDSVSE